MKKMRKVLIVPMTILLITILVVKYEEMCTRTANHYATSGDETVIKSILEKYIFGENLSGRNLSEILDENKCFISEASTMANANTELQFEASFVEGMVEPNIYRYNIYFKYADETYKANFIKDDNNKYTTEASYGVTKIEIDIENTRIGKQVSYDGVTWTILYDDSINGLQMICNEIYKYEDGDFYLGCDDSSITDWDSLITEADLNKNGGLDNLEKSIYSYNNAITTLNAACESVVGLDDNIIDIRCVGSNPTNKDSENTEEYTSSNLARWPENNSIHSAGIVNGKVKDTDLNYVTDIDRIIALQENLYDYENYGWYWLASRVIDESSSRLYCWMRCAKMR